MKTILVVNCPGIITWLYSFVKPFIPEVRHLSHGVSVFRGAALWPNDQFRLPRFASQTTQKKISFTSGNGYAELLGWTKDPRLIPAEFGGLGPPQAALLAAFAAELDAFVASVDGHVPASGHGGAGADFPNLANLAGAPM